METTKLNPIAAMQYDSLHNIQLNSNYILLLFQAYTHPHELLISLTVPYIIQPQVHIIYHQESLVKPAFASQES